MGVAGSGKSTIGAALAENLGRRFVEGDSLHSSENVAKMASGQPLEDADRWPWLAAIRNVLRGNEPVVVACSALRRRYRDLLRDAGPVVFVLLDLDEPTAAARAGTRRGHFMAGGMVASQFSALERPGDDEPDVVVIPAGHMPEDVLSAAATAIVTSPIAPAVPPILADGAADRRMSDDDIGAHLDALVDAEVIARNRRRILIVPPDHTRLHSRAGEIAVALRERLLAHGCEVGVLPALGTHVPMNAAACEALFGGSLTPDELLVHDWRSGLRSLGEIGAGEVSIASGGRFAEPIDVAVSRQLFDGWDLVVSIGQVVPHEVIGMANFTKNLVVGLGGEATIHRTHFVGAVAGMESMMGRASSPVRDLVDGAFDRFIAPLVPVLWLLTVVEDTSEGTVLRGLYAGSGGTRASGGAAYRAAAGLSQRVNVTMVEEPLRRCVCRLDPTEFHSTWLGNKAVYRTRMAMADGGELVVLAPGVRRFGEDSRIDDLIRRHGYRGTPATLAAVSSDADLAESLGAAAHLIHGSSEGRFEIVYCTDPDAGGLSEGEVEAVGYRWRSLPAELDRLGINENTPTGSRRDRSGRQFHYVANPALGLWTTRAQVSLDVA